MVSIEQILNLSHDLSSSTAPSAGCKKERVVIVGCGTVAHKFVGKLKDDPNAHARMEVTVIGTTSNMEMTPALFEFITGVKSAKEVEIPFPQVKGFAKFVEGLVSDVDFKTKRVFYSSSGFQGSLEYDSLILATGANNNVSTPGASAHCHFVKTRASTAKLISTIDHILENERSKSGSIPIVVVGGGITGVETISAISDYINRTGVQKWGTEVCSRVELVLVNAGNRFPAVAPEATSEYVMAALERHHIKTYAKTKVSAVEPTSLSLFGEGSTAPPSIPYKLCVWAVGLQNTPLINSLRDKIAPGTRGPIKVNERMEVVGVNHVWAAGDCCAITPSPLSEVAHILLSKAKETGFDSFFTEYGERIQFKYPQANFKNSPTLSNDDDFTEYLSSLDSSYRSPTPKMMTSYQAGVHLASIFSTIPLDSRSAAKSFVCVDSGSMVAIPAVGDQSQDTVAMPDGWKIRQIMSPSAKA